MKVTLTGSTINVATIKSVLENNSRVYISLPINDVCEILVTRLESHFNGYIKQDSIEVKYAELDCGEIQCMATEYFNINMMEKAAMAAVERYNSEDPCEFSNYSVAFENTFIKE